MRKEIISVLLISLIGSVTVAKRVDEEMENINRSLDTATRLFDKIKSIAGEGKKDQSTSSSSSWDNKNEQVNEAGKITSNASENTEKEVTRTTDKIEKATTGTTDNAGGKSQPSDSTVKK